MLKRFASRVVLAFDADKAGQGAAERFYEWEEKYKVAGDRRPLPGGQGPRRAGACATPRRCVDAVDEAVPFLGFRLQRVLDCAAAATRRRTGPAWPRRRWPW